MYCIILWGVPSDVYDNVTSQLLKKVLSSAGSEVEMVGWCHRFSGRELGQTPADGEGQGSLAG